MAFDHANQTAWDAFKRRARALDAINAPAEWYDFLSWGVAKGQRATRTTMK